MLRQERLRAGGGGHLHEGGALRLDGSVRACSWAGRVQLSSAVPPTEFKEDFSSSRVAAALALMQRIGARLTLVLRHLDRARPRVRSAGNRLRYHTVACEGAILSNTALEAASLGDER